MNSRFLLPLAAAVLILPAARSVTLSVDIIQGNADLINAWDAYSGGGPLVLTNNVPGVPGNPGVAGQINFRRAQMDDLAMNPIGIFDVGNVGPGATPGNIRINADARTWNYGGRSGAMALTDVFIESTVQTLPGVPIIIRMVISENYGIDTAWLNTLDPASQWGWDTGLSATIGLTDPGQRVDIGVVSPPSQVYNQIAAGVSVFAQQNAEPVGGGFDWYNVGSGSVHQGGVRPPNGTLIFNVSYTVDFVINAPLGGAANPIVIRMDNSLDGVGSGSGFADEASPLPPGIPEPTSAALFAGFLGLFLRRSRRA